jgi:L-amino acid N-acyltransferase YncA
MTSDPMPPLDVLVDVADAAAHPWISAHVPEPVRRAAFTEDIGFWYHTAARDMTYASEFARHAPPRGLPDKAYLDRWLSLGDGFHVLAGPRYLGRDPDLPFVGVSASDRPLRPPDRDRLVSLAGTEFAAFGPGFVMVTTADPVGAWPGTTPEMRYVAGLLGDLRRRPVPPEVTTRPRRDLDVYPRYRAIHDAHVRDEPVHARHARCESRDDLEDLAARDLLYDILVDGVWAGLLAAEPDSRQGMRGATVVELILDRPYRHRGLGRHLSPLLARELPMPDDRVLMGTIHTGNTASYRSALAAGRVDVGGEIVIPIPHR